MMNLFVCKSVGLAGGFSGLKSMIIFPALDIYCQIAFQKGGSNFHSDTAYGHGCVFRCALTSVQWNLKIFVAAHLMGRKQNH